LFAVLHDLEGFGEVGAGAIYGAEASDESGKQLRLVVKQTERTEKAIQRKGTRMQRSFEILMSLILAGQT